MRSARPLRTPERPVTAHVTEVRPGVRPQAGPVVVLQPGDDGAFGCDLSDPAAGEASGEVLLMGGSALGSTFVVVTTPHETITLSGPALTPENAVPLARALRPV